MRLDLSARAADQIHPDRADAQQDDVHDRHDARLQRVGLECVLRQEQRSRSGCCRVPVSGEDVDVLIGVAYLKDAVRATAFNPAAMERAVESIVRQPLLVPESKPVDDLIHEMQRSRQQVAVVVDEYGGIAGMVTIEDAIEQIVGRNANRRGFGLRRGRSVLL